MIKRRLLILCLLIISMTLVYHAKSYTMAKIGNTAELSITSSDNALIALPENLKLTVDKHIYEDITLELTDSGEKVTNRIVEVSYVAADNNLQIKNNMNEVINVEVRIDGDYKGININDFCTLSPGRSINNINVKVDENIQDIPKSIDIKIYADWNGGAAEIDNKINLKVNNIEPQINVNTLDLRTPVLEEVPLNNDENNSDENIDRSENENYSEISEGAAPIETQKDINESMNEDSRVEDNDKKVDENSHNSLENSVEDIKPEESEELAIDKQDS